MNEITDRLLEEARVILDGGIPYEGRKTESYSLVGKIIENIKNGNIGIFDTRSYILVPRHEVRKLRFNRLPQTCVACGEMIEMGEPKAYRLGTGDGDAAAWHDRCYKKPGEQR